MTLRRGIAVTLFIPAAVVLVIWLAFRFYWPVPAGMHPHQREDFEVIGEDGTVLPVSLLNTGKPDPLGIVILVPDSGLDRNWNPRGTAFRTGALAGRFLAGAGWDVLLYDQRGTGQSQISGRHYPDLAAQVDDLAVILRTAGARRPGLPLVLIGHGNGCSVVLRAAVRAELQRPEPGSLRLKEVVLLSCGYDGTLLDHWGERVFGNMEEIRVDAGLIRDARIVWRGVKDSWKAGRIPELPPAPTRYAKHPDWGGFEAALKSLSSPERRSWALEAPRVVFRDDLAAALKKTRVSHYMPEFEEEMPAREREALMKLAASQRSESYRFEVIPRTGHLLKEQKSPASGPIDRLVVRAGPFRGLAPGFVKVLGGLAD